MGFAYGEDIINKIIFREFSDFSCLNILLKLVALQKDVCDEIPQEKLQFDRRLEILSQLLAEFEGVLLSHENSAFDL